jgi:hypothetical protein
MCCRTVLPRIAFYPDAGFLFAAWRLPLAILRTPRPVVQSIGKTHYANLGITYAELGE